LIDSLRRARVGIGTNILQILIDNIGVRTRVLISQLPNGEPYYIPKFQPKILKFEKIIAIFETGTLRVGIGTNILQNLIDNIGVRTRVLISQLPNGEPYYIPKFQPKILKFEKVIAIFENRNFYGAVKKSINECV